MEMFSVNCLLGLLVLLVHFEFVRCERGVLHAVLLFARIHTFLSATAVVQLINPTSDVYASRFAAERTQRVVGVPSINV
jgi:hypothetical protein